MLYPFHHAAQGGSVEGSIGQLKREISNRFSEVNQFGTKYFGFKNDIDANTELLLALRGDTNVRPEAIKLAGIFHEAMDFLVKEAKAVGIKFSPLENYTPQPMDFRKISTVSKEEFVARTIPRLDIGEYQRRGIKDGESLRSFVGEVYETLASEGRNKTIASLGKNIGHQGSIGGRLRQPRQLHYTPQGLAASMKEFGSEITVDGMMGRSFDNLIRDISVAREFGANAHDNFEVVLAATYERDKKNRIDRHPPDTKARDKTLAKLDSEEKNAREYFDRLARGKAPPTTLDKMTDAMLAWQVVTKMGKQVFYVPIDMVNSVAYASRRMGTSWTQTAKEIWSASPISNLTNKEKKAFINHITVGIEHARMGFSHDLEMSSRNIIGIMAKKTMV